MTRDPEEVYKTLHHKQYKLVHSNSPIWTYRPELQAMVGVLIAPFFNQDIRVQKV